MVKDLSCVFGKAIAKAEKYNSKLIADELELKFGIWCRLEDDSNLEWYLISENNGKTIVNYYGYLSKRFPVAIIKDICPDDICRVLHKREVLIEKYYERYMCDEFILNKFVADKSIIDDRFLYEGNIPFNEELFLRIDEGERYIKPYNFTIEELTQ